MKYWYRGAAEEGMATAVDVRDWLEQALLLMHDVDTKLESLLVKDAPFATDWGSFARDTMQKLHAMEEVKHVLAA